jgi:hypothetical protein
MTRANASGSSFSFTVDEAFRFADGSTVIVGIADSSNSRLVPSEAAVTVDGRTVAHIRLTEERMPGPKMTGQRGLVTRDSVDINILRSGSCVLLCRR